MQDYHNYPENDPRHHTIQIRQRLHDLSIHLRTDIEKIDDPQGQALFETSAEVLDGLLKAFQHYEERSEKAWKR